MSDIFDSVGVNYASPSKVGGTGTTIKIFPSLTNAAAPAILQLLEQQDGQVVTLTASGSLFVHGTSPTVNFTLQSGTSLTGTSNTTISALTTPASLTTNANYPWALKINLQGDHASGIVQVVSSAFTVNGVQTVAASFSNTSLTGVVFSGALASPPVFEPEVGVNLVLGCTFAVSDALNSASLFEYQLEA
jgi:hypothetical protein